MDVADDISDVPAQSKNKSTYYQIAKVDAGLLAWNFKVLDEHAEEIASVDRAFRGFGREVRAFETRLLPMTMWLIVNSPNRYLQIQVLTRHKSILIHD